MFTVDVEVLIDEFLSEIENKSVDSKFFSIISANWRPPLIFREKENGDSWFINVGQPHQFFSNWRVYIVEPSGAKLRCSVQFGPTVKNAIYLLPKPVRELARLLDQTTGPGENEGTLQPTDQLRLTVQHTWSNVILRPWVSFTPYNTRKEVDAGLRNWSQAGKSFANVYRRIRRQYPVAEKSLSEYYQKGFNLTASEANSLAEYLLDGILRSHYVFHREDRIQLSNAGGPKKNPWVVH